MILGGSKLNLIEGIKDVASVLQKADNIELYQKILDLQKAALDLVEENMKLRERVRNYENIENIKDSLVFIDNCYYFRNKDDSLEGPLCPTCWDKDNKVIRMRNTSQVNPNFYRCNVCDSFTTIL